MSSKSPATFLHQSSSPSIDDWELPLSVRLKPAPLRLGRKTQTNPNGDASNQSTEQANKPMIECVSEGALSKVDTRARKAAEFSPIRMHAYTQSPSTEYSADLNHAETVGHADLDARPVGKE